MMSWKLYDIIWVLCYFGPLINLQHVDKPLRVYVYSYDFEYVLVL